jgi:tetratricopeptide (TPR) repeat protein
MVNMTPLMEDLIPVVVEFEEGKTIRIFELHYTSSLGAGEFWFIWPEKEESAQLKKLRRRIDDFVKRGADVGFTIRPGEWELVVPSIHHIVRRVAEMKDEQFSTRLSGELMSMIPTLYVRKKDKVRARIIAEAAFSMSGSRLTGHANNIGYLFMDAGEYAEARLWFEAAAQYADEDFEQLLQYNMGVLDALTGDFDSARRHFVQAKESHYTDASCVYRLFVDGGVLRHEEVSDPKSIETLADEAMRIIDSFVQADPRHLH